MKGIDVKQLVPSPTLASINFFPQHHPVPSTLLLNSNGGGDQLHASNLFYQALAKNLTLPHSQQQLFPPAVQPFAQASSVDAGQMVVMGQLMHRLFLLQRIQQHQRQQLEQRVSPGPVNGPFTITSLLSPSKDGPLGMNEGRADGIGQSLLGVGGGGGFES